MQKEIVQPVGYINQEACLDFLAPSGATRQLDDLQQLLIQSSSAVAEDSTPHQLHVSDQAFSKFQTQLQKQFQKLQVKTCHKLCSRIIKNTKYADVAVQVSKHDLSSF